MESSGNAAPQDAARVVLMLRVGSLLKTRLAAYAEPRGLTLNSAAITLLDQALREAGETRLRLGYVAPGSETCSLLSPVRW
jgi:hypothetical protein